uniref:Cyclic nucleotide-binding domain-containing protein n=1 Tax=Globisporangium ultimum (strain ATCC 200006 / CBS 805.95 / DAOM BR144) TaxID=431595 RepID=K3WUP8_GLOUD
MRTSVLVPAEEKNHPSRFALKLSKFCHQNRRYFSYLKAPILDPRTNAKLTWDSLIMLIVLYSAIVIPIEVGFPDLEFGMGWGSISIATDVLFCFDVVQNFFVGYYISEEEPMVRDRKLIACKYLSSWFIPDVLAIIPADYVINGINNDPETRDKSVLSLKLTRMVRLVRITKLARLIKLRQFAMKMEDVLELDAVLTRMTRLISQVLLVTHVLACFWHLVGYTDDTAAVTWITSSGLADQNANARYLYSFYWVVATVAGVGYGDIHATNTDERLYSMVTMVIGAGGFGLIIANITKILEMWNRETTSRVRKLSIVQEFVKKKAIPKQLKTNLLRYFRHYIAKTSAFDERELLCEFSLSLRGEILQETYKNSFFKIPAFQRLSGQFVMDMAMYIKPLIAVSGDILAKENSVGTEMFILNTGIIEVKRTAPNGEWIVVLEILTEHGVFGESSLLNYTLHQNSYTAKSSCDLYTLPKEDFDRLIEEFPDAEHTLLRYHQDRSALYDRVFQQTLARYRVYLNSQKSDPVSEMVGIENVYPTLTVLLDGVLTSYRSVPIPILQRMTLDLSMGVSVFNSATEKQRMIDILSYKDKMSFMDKIKTKFRTPINPDNPYKLAWDFFVGMQLIYCAIAIPIEITFLSEESDLAGWIINLELAIEIMFAIDVMMNFRTAILDRANHLITNPWDIARMYLRGWFLIDFVSVFPISAVVGVCVGNNYGSRSLYLIRSVRLLKLARVLKLIRTLMRVETIAVASHSSLRVVRLVFKVFFIAHILTCGFYYVSITSVDVYGDSLMRWIPTYYSTYEKYVFCMYWSVTTMTTVGYGDSNPGNPVEVAYVTFGVMIGASTFTYVVGTLSSLVDELHVNVDTYRERMDRLKAYLKEREVPKPLAARLRRYYEYYLMQRDDENEDTILCALSDNLRSQLVLHLNRDVVSKIVFFASQDDTCVSYLMGILDPEFCTPGEYVFKEGQIGRHMYFLVKGVAEVLFHAGTPEEVIVMTLLEGSYFGEIAMLTMSKRAASIRAKTYISLFVLSRSGLDRISLHYPEMASNIIQEFRKKITHIKQTSVKQLAPLMQEDVRAARLQHGLFGGGNLSELTETLEELEEIVGHIVKIYGGGDKGKRKALACVMQHLRKYEFSLDDFLLAAEEVTCLRESLSPVSSGTNLAKAAYSVVMLNKLQIKMRRRSSFS